MSRIIAIILSFLMLCPAQPIAINQLNLTNTTEPSIAVDTTQPTAEIPDRLATTDELVAVVADQLAITPTLDSLLNAEAISTTEYTVLSKNEGFSFMFAWQILLPVFGIFPYPAELYPEITPVAGCASEYAEARIAAVQIGVAAIEDDPTTLMSIRDFSALTQKLQTGDFLPLVCPRAWIPATDLEVITRANYQQRNALMRVEMAFPVSWIEDFLTESWKLIRCDYIPADEPAPPGASEIVGLTRRVEHEILFTIMDVPTIGHEITHYAAARIGWREPFLRKYYREEAAATAKILGPYSQTNPDEYFAEFVATWLARPELRAKLTKVAPQTAAICQNIQNQFPELLADYKITKKCRASI